MILRMVGFIFFLAAALSLVKALVVEERSVPTKTEARDAMLNRRELQTGVQKTLARTIYGNNYQSFESSGTLTQWSNSNDKFGRGDGGCVAISDNWAMIGAHEGKKAYIYAYNSGDNTWGTTADTTLTETANGFGYTVGMTTTASYIIVGTDGTTAYIYEYNNGWVTTALATLTVSGQTSRVAISDNYAVIGDFNNNVAYIYARDNTNGWPTTATSTLTYSNQFGMSVSLTDNFMLVGQPGNQTAYLFGQTGGTWSELAWYNEGTNNFGTAVVMEGAWMAVGDPGAGAVYVYEYNPANTPQWTAFPVQRVAPTGITDFGYKLGISPSYLMVGTNYGDGTNGKAYLYEREDLSSTSRFSYGDPEPLAVVTGNNNEFSKNGVGISDTYAMTTQFLNSGAHVYLFGLYEVDAPSGQPSGQPSRQPTSSPSMPTFDPTSMPTGQPSIHPTTTPSSQPSSGPTTMPSGQPTSKPSIPTSQPTTMPSGLPTVQPTSAPSSQPSSRPSTQPSSSPTMRPSGQPTGLPTTQPTSDPSSAPTSTPTSPTSLPSALPSARPTPVPDLSLVVPFLPWQPIIYTVLALTFVCTVMFFIRYFTKRKFSPVHWCAGKLGYYNKKEEARVKERAENISRRKVAPLKQLEEARAYKHEGVGPGGGLSRSGKTPLSNKISPIPEYGSSQNRQVINRSDLQHRLSGFFVTSTGSEEEKGEEIRPAISATLADRHNWNSARRSPRVAPNPFSSSSPSPSQTGRDAGGDYKGEEMSRPVIKGVQRARIRPRLPSQNTINNSLY